MTPNEVREQFRTELQFAAGPIHEASRTNYEGALKFADAAIKAVFALNGGGLIAFPAFIALFKIDAQLHARWIITAGAIFVLGLICAAFTTLLGYLSAMTAVESQHHLLNATTAKYAVIFQQPPSKIDPATSDKLASDLTDQSVGLRKVAVGAGFASLLAFIIGAVISGWLLVYYRP